MIALVLCRFLVTMFSLAVQTLFMPFLFFVPGRDVIDNTLKL